MKAFQVFLMILLDAVIVLSTLGVLVFTMYVIFGRAFAGEYWRLLAIFAVLDVCAIILLAGLLGRITAAAAAVVIGALLHLILYTLNSNWTISFSPMFNLSAAADVIVIMVMTTVAYLCAQRRPRTSEVSQTAATAKPSDRSTAKRGFWSSLDQGNKVAIVTSLITAITTIVTAIIGILPHSR
jgi:hypothetical protein